MREYNNFLLKSDSDNIYLVNIAKILQIYYINFIKLKEVLKFMKKKSYLHVFFLKMENNYLKKKKLLQEEIKKTLNLNNENSALEQNLEKIMNENQFLEKNLKILQNEIDKTSRETIEKEEIVNFKIEEEKVKKKKNNQKQKNKFSKTNSIISPIKFLKKSTKIENQSLIYHKMDFLKKNQEKAFELRNLHKDKSPKNFRNFIPLNLILM